MPQLNPWIYIGVLLAFIAVGTGCFFFGRSTGVDSVKANLADDYKAQLKQLGKDAAAITAKATSDALADYKARTAALDDLTASISKAQGVINAASSKLQSSLKGGACVLSPVQRHLLECVRRPESPGCVAAAPAH